MLLFRALAEADREGDTLDCVLSSGEQGSVGRDRVDRSEA